MISEDLLEGIKKIPIPGEWWHLSSEESYIGLAERLMKYGMSDEEILDVLGWAYAAAANEFGG